MRVKADRTHFIPLLCLPQEDIEEQRSTKRKSRTPVYTGIIKQRIQECHGQRSRIVHRTVLPFKQQKMFNDIIGQIQCDPVKHNGSDNFIDAALSL
ncbi:hypothetical protein D3C80_1332180 [compost metagenome]